MAPWFSPSLLLLQVCASVEERGVSRSRWELGAPRPPGGHRRMRGRGFAAAHLTGCGSLSEVTHTSWGELDGLVGHDHRANDPQRLGPAAATLPFFFSLRGTAATLPRKAHLPTPRAHVPARLRGPRPTRSLAQHHRLPVSRCGRARPSAGAQRRSAALRALLAPVTYTQPRRLHARCGAVWWWSMVHSDLKGSSPL